MAIGPQDGRFQRRHAPLRLAFPFIAFLASLAATLAGAEAHAVEMRAGRVSPGLSGTIPFDGSLFVEFHYTADEPTRFQARGYRRGQPAAGRFRVNHAFPDPAGDGTSLVWIAFSEPVEIDELGIVAFDGDWNEVAETRLAVALEWRGEREGGRQAPRWVLDIEARKRAYSDGFVHEGLGAGEALAMGILGSAVMALLPAYLGLQVWTLFAFSGRWRALAAVPAALMVPLLAFSLVALAAGSGLWPMTLVLAAPFGLAWLLIVWGARRLARPA